MVSGLNEAFGRLVEDCPTCEGRGVSALNAMLGALGGSDAVVDPCPACGGRGWTPNPEAVKALAVASSIATNGHAFDYMNDDDEKVSYDEYATQLVVGLVDYALQGDKE